MKNDVVSKHSEVTFHFYYLIMVYYEFANLLLILIPSSYYKSVESEQHYCNRMYAQLYVGQKHSGNFEQDC